MSHTILLITGRFHPVICGVGHHTAGLRQWFIRQGHRVLIATGTEASQGENGVWVYPEKGRVAWFARFCAAERITHVLWQYSPYALDGKGMPGWVLPVATAMAKAGIRQAVYFHEIRIRYSVPGMFNTLRAWRQQQIAHSLSGLCKGVGTNIEFNRAYLHKSGKAIQIIPVPPNIDAPRKGIDSRNEGDFSRRSAEPVSDHCRIAPPVSPKFLPPLPAERGAVGVRLSLFANRALPEVVSALALVQKEHPGLEVTWFGKGAGFEDGSLQARVAASGLVSRFTGQLSLEDLAAEMEKSGLLLLPQPLERGVEGGISLKNGTLAAAFLLGLPVIATRGDMTDTSMLVHGQHIHLLNANSTEDWYKAIHHLLGEAAYREKLGHEALQFHERHLAWPVVGNQLFELLTG